MVGEPAASGFADAEPRRVHQLLIDPLFGPYFAGKLLSLSGIWIHNVVSVILAFQLTHSAAVVGLVSIAQFLPQLLFSPLSGVMADRGDRQLQMIVGRFVCAAGSGGLGLWVWLAGEHGLPGAFPIILCSAFVGVGFTIGGPAMQALLPSLVRPREVLNAVTLDNMPMTLGRSVGPALGALIATTAGFAVAFAVAGVTNLVFAIIVMMLRIPKAERNASDPEVSVRSGLRFLRTEPTVMFLLIGVAAVGIGADPAITLAPSIAHDIDGGTALVGWFASSFGIGSMLGLALLPLLRAYLGPMRLTYIGLIMMAAGSLAMLVVHARVPVLGAFGLSGAGMTIALTGSTTMIYARVPDAMRGRIMAFWIVGFVGSRPLAAAMNGLLADVGSTAVALTVTGVVVLIAACLCRPKLIAPPGPQIV